jgi:putative nucleotidyltransferase with HDIG domain
MALLEPTWQCARVADCATAHSVLTAHRFDAFVLDGVIAGGAQFLAEQEKTLARAVCLVRCGTSDRAVAGRWKGSRCTLLAEDGDATVVAARVKASTRLWEWMAHPAMKKLLPRIRKLPTAPELYTQVEQELQSPTGSLQVVSHLIGRDPLMSAKILQVANSAFFALTHEVSDIGEAVMVLGSERIRSLILLAGVFSQYGDVKCPGFSPEPVWQHSVQVGEFTRAIALGETKNAKTAEAAFTAGLLHDVGKLVLASNVPEMYETVLRLKASKKISQREAEMEALGTTHAEVGACLLGTWGLPLWILEAIAWHHEPGRCKAQGFTLLAAVHAANVFVLEATDADTRERVNLMFLLQAGLGDCRNRWREFCGVNQKQEGQTPGENLRRRREAKEN